uniref:Uncharacterized protein n=1 Tax=Tetraselmis sp. GSL018 TaxID=582737 RepID=A0A061SDS5_9CHLO
MGHDRPARLGLTCIGSSKRQPTAPLSVCPSVVLSAGMSV